MDFMSIAHQRQSCRSYDSTRAVETEKLEAILEAGMLAPSACNSQPYHITVCSGETARQAAQATQGMGLNAFATQAPIVLVISEKAYTPSAAIGSKVKKNDYRSIDIGILSAYLTSEATAQGLSTCILGWFDDAKLRKVCGLDQPVRLAITLGYAADGDPLRAKKRRPLDEMVTRIG